MLHKAIALETEQGTQSSVAAERFRFSSKLRTPRESEGIALSPILFAFLADDVGLFPLLLKDSCFQLYTILPVI